MQPNIKTKQMKIIPAETSKNIVPYKIDYQKNPNYIETYRSYNI